jgi:hypothetical protein
MGHIERAREQQLKRKKEEPIRILKAIVAFFLTLPILPFAIAKMAYKENKWVWDEL